ncbi:MAG: serine/threonine protein kinase [Myxococcales bacterium]|nr:serine/threonine protein kinase [Myxococcales bacterium]
MLPTLAPIGSVIAGYVLGDVLGAGGGGAVYATRGAGGQALAIKVIPHAGDPTARARAERELAAMIRLEHPSVVRIVDGGVTAELTYVVMPRLEGVSLRALLADGGLGPEAAVVLVAGVAAGAAALHAVGLVHRDLKPDNAILTATGQVVVIDLGLALDAAWTRQTHEGAVAGSVPYLAPEQIEGEVSPASDVWALGVMLYELTCGQRPFGRARAPEEVAAILAGARAPIDELDRRVAPGLAALVDRLLARDRAARPADAAAVVAALAPWVEAATAGAPPATVARRIVGDRAAWQAEVAAREADRAVALAADASARGDAFAAMRAIDRGLAYRPDHPGLAAALATALPAPAAPPVGPTPATVVALPAPPPVPRGGLRWSWLGGGVAILAIGAVVGSQVVRRRGHGSYTDPAQLIATLVDAARSGDASELADLCQPGRGDRDVRELCELTETSPRFPAFREMFRDAQVLAVRRGWDGAEVDFRFDGGHTETMKMVIAGGRLYLDSF